MSVNSVTSPPITSPPAPLPFFKVSIEHHHPYAITKHSVIEHGKEISRCQTHQKVILAVGIIFGLIAATFLANTFGSLLAGGITILTTLSLGVFAWDHFKKTIKFHEKGMHLAKIWDELKPEDKKREDSRLIASYKYYEKRRDHYRAHKEKLQREVKAEIAKNPYLDDNEEEVLQIEQSIYEAKQGEAIAIIKMAWMQYLRDDPDPPSKKLSSLCTYRVRTFKEYNAQQHSDRVYGSKCDWFIVFGYEFRGYERLTLDEVLLYSNKIQGLADKLSPHTQPHTCSQPTSGATTPQSPPQAGPTPSAPHTTQLQPAFPSYSLPDFPPLEHVYHHTTSYRSCHVRRTHSSCHIGMITGSCESPRTGELLLNALREISRDSSSAGLAGSTSPLSSSGERRDFEESKEGPPPASRSVPPIRIPSARSFESDSHVRTSPNSDAEIFALASRESMSAS